MLQSKLFTKTRKEAPAEEVAKNAELLIRAGFIHKEMAGVYSYLPLGLRVLNKIEGIIRTEMDAIGGSEMRTSVIQSKEVFVQISVLTKVVDLVLTMLPLLLGVEVVMWPMVKNVILKVL